ncbi:MAG: hypothetical protein A4S09_01655 [Proteobacteria bacterium SG_bin7]|nr:MAG: hypothetical protein A4S09_01655 [Proteobacteria bacterium SG_bin7]
MFVSLWNGFISPLVGLRYLKNHPKLLGLAAVPFLANILVVVFGLTFIINNSYFISDLVTKYGFAADGGWLFWILHSALVVLAWITLIVFVTIAGYFSGQLFASPFSSLLAERTLVSCGGMTDRPFKFSSWMSLSLRMLKVTFIKATVFLFIGTILFFLSFWPPITIFCHMGILLMLAFDCADYSFESLGFSFGQRLSFFATNIFSFIGLASSIGIILLVPGLNFFIFPASLVGITLLVGDIRKPEVVTSGN